MTTTTTPQRVLVTICIGIVLGDMFYYDCNFKDQKQIIHSEIRWRINISWNMRVHCNKNKLIHANKTFYIQTKNTPTH